MIRSSLFASAMLACLALSLPAQQSANNETANVVPHLLKFSGVLVDDSGKPPAGILGVTFSLYRDQQGGAPLWMETQNVQPDKAGHYSVMLGSASSQGLPADLFASGEPRWVGVQLQGLTEQPRVMLVSVPYAMKAGDAATVGGLPPSAFLRATPAQSAGSGEASSSLSFNSVVPPLSGSGTTDFLPIWTSTTTLGNSALFQSGTGSAAKVGINTTTPASTLDVKGGGTIRGLFSLPATGTATSTAGKNSQPEDFVASSFSSTTHTAVNQTFQWQAEPAGNNTPTPSGTLNLLFGSGTSNPTETGLNISNKGIFSFASGQTFPGTGTITGVTAGSDLTGGGTSGTVTLNLDTTKVPQLATANTFTANQAVIGNLSGTNEVSAGGPPSFHVAAGTVEVDAAAINSGSWFPALSFGGGGEVIASDRKGSANHSGLDFFTAFTPRMSIDNAGLVGIGTRSPGSQLEVDSHSVSTTAIQGYGFTATSGSGQDGSAALVATGGNGDLTDANGTVGGIGVLGFGGEGAGFPGSDGIGGVFVGGNFVGNSGDGVDAYPGSGLAGYFQGDVNVTGTLTASTKDFKIDHPLDPGNKYLVHASVESSEMLNIYTGNVVTDAGGEATVRLPDWFEAVNTDFRYQLTVIGQFAQAILGNKIQNHEFTIRTNLPNVEVSWLVAGVRQDAYAKAHPLIVEEEKEAKLRGFYMHPELYGAASEKQIEWARHPKQMRQMQEHRQQGKKKQVQLSAMAKE